MIPRRAAVIDEHLIQHFLECAPIFGPLVRRHLSWCPVPPHYVLAEHPGSLAGLLGRYRYYLDPLAKVLDHHHDEVVPVFRL